MGFTVWHFPYWDYDIDSFTQFKPAAMITAQQLLVLMYHGVSLRFCCSLQFASVLTIRSPFMKFLADKKDSEANTFETAK